MLDQIRFSRAPRGFLPAGALNVVCGDRDTGYLVVGHRIPQMVSITGKVMPACSMISRPTVVFGGRGRRAGSA
jgi:acyl-CoA reductase-like NAD-dependent aldehyde dehydrogenase